MGEGAGAGAGNGRKWKGTAGQGRGGRRDEQGRPRGGPPEGPVVERHANASLVVCRRSMKFWRGADHGGVFVLPIIINCLCEGTHRWGHSVGGRE